MDLTGFPALDVAIGLSLIFLIFSLVCSAINEAVAALFALRARTLQHALRGMLDNAGAGPCTGLTVDKIAEHPLVASLVSPGKTRPWRRTLPSYMPSRTFASAVLDTIAPPNGKNGKNGKNDQIARARDYVEKLDQPQLKATLLSLIEHAGDERDRLRVGLERWFDDTMERASGWYKRRVQLLMIVWALIVAFAFNVDSFQITNTLWHDDALRTAVVAEAQEQAKATQQSADSDAVLQTRLDEAGRRVSKVQQLKVPVGWSNKKDDPRHTPSNFNGWIAKVLGILIAVIALSLGAPFWFDTLSKLVSLRSTGPKPPDAAQEQKAAKAAA